jgi:two-component sensor histidine kinase
VKKTRDLRLLRHLRESAWARYGIALAAFLISFFLREALAPWLSSDRGIIVFLPAILFVTFSAGLGPGLLTTLLSGIALWYVFLPPHYSFAFSLDTAVGLATFAFGSVAGVALVHLLEIATARAKAEQERSAELAASVTADLAGMTQLNNLSSLLVREGKDLKTCLNHALETAIAITNADKGNVQLFDGNAVALTIAAHRGFEDKFLKFFELVRSDNTACAEAMRSAKRVIVEDVTRSEIFAAADSSLKVLADAGVRAVISTPLTSGDGGLLGMISVHFMAPHRPAERELGLMDLLARQTADYLERKRAEEVEQYLVREVQHRSNNLLAVIQAIAHRSLSGEYSLADAKAAFEARLQALARANRQLTRSSWSGVDLTDLARLELEPFGDRSTIRGINIILDAQHAQNFTLAARASDQCDQIWRVVQRPRQGDGVLDGDERKSEQQAEFQMAGDGRASGRGADQARVWLLADQGDVLERALRLRPRRAELRDRCFAAAQHAKRHQYDTFRKSSAGWQLIETPRCLRGFLSHNRGFRRVAGADGRSRHVHRNFALDNNYLETAFLEITCLSVTSSEAIRALEATSAALRHPVRRAMRDLAACRPVAWRPQ